MWCANMQPKPALRPWRRTICDVVTHGIDMPPEANRSRFSSCSATSRFTASLGASGMAAEGHQIDSYQGATEFLSPQRLTSIVPDSLSSGGII